MKMLFMACVQLSEAEQQIIRELLEGILYTLYLRQQVEARLKDVAADRVTPHEEVKAALLDRKRMIYGIDDERQIINILALVQVRQDIQGMKKKSWV